LLIVKKPCPRLFVPSSKRWLNVDFGGCLPPVETFEFYGEAYHSAARILLANFSPRRIAFAPIGFLYRHALELHLKDVVISGQKLLEKQGKAFSAPGKILNSTQHSLLELWKAVKRMHAELGWDDEGLDRYEQLITQFHEVDERSFGFRYPVDRKCNPVLLWDSEFNPKWFSKKMAALISRIQSISNQIAQELDALRDEAEWYEGG
jgi:hypothetical protein